MSTSPIAHRPTLANLLAMEIPLSMKGLPASQRKDIVRQAQKRLAHVPGNLALMDAMMSFHEAMASVPDWQGLRLEPEEDGGGGSIALAILWGPDGEEGEWMALDFGEEMFEKELELYGFTPEPGVVEQLFRAVHDMSWIQVDPQALESLRALSLVSSVEFSREQVANPAPCLFVQAAEAIRAWEQANEMDATLPCPAPAAPRRRGP